MDLIRIYFDAIMGSAPIRAEDREVAEYLFYSGAMSILQTLFDNKEQDQRALKWLLANEIKEALANNDLCKPPVH